jgi:predicted RNase H-like HicB family nuclease
MEQMTTYTAIFERAADGGWSAHVPDLPTILVGADTFEEAKERMQEAIEVYVEAMKEQGLSVPAPSTQIVAAEMIVPFESA